MRYTRSFYSVYLFFAAAIGAFFSMRWLDARASLDLDELRCQVPDNPAPLARFRAFIARALNHPAYTAGYYDPGRSFA